MMRELRKIYNSPIHKKWEANWGVGKLYLYSGKKRSKQTINPTSYFINFFHYQPAKFLFCTRVVKNLLLQ